MRLSAHRTALAATATVLGLAATLGGHGVMRAGQAVLSGGVLLLAGALLASVGLAYLPHPSDPLALPRNDQWGRARLALGLAIGLATAPLFLLNLGDLRQYHGDESMWMVAGLRSFKLAFVEHSAADPFWRDEFLTWGSYNPPIGKYLIGAGLYLGGVRDIPGIPYDYALDATWNIAHNRLDAPDLPAHGRLFVAMTGALSCSLLFWLVARVASLWHAGLTVALYLMAPLPLIFGRRAMIDIPALCWSLLALVALLGTVRALRDGARGAVLRAGLTGAACGLAVGTKMNALLVCAVVAGALGWELLGGLRRRDGHRATLAGAAIGVWALWVWVVFFLPNPFLYGQPLDGTRHMLSLSGIIQNFNGALHTPAERLSALWSALVSYGALGYRLHIPGDRPLLLVGLAGVLLSLRGSAPPLRPEALPTLLLWLLVGYVGIALWLPLPWDRYFVPLGPLNALLQAYGTIWILTALARRWKGG